MTKQITTLNVVLTINPAKTILFCCFGSLAIFLDITRGIPLVTKLQSRKNSDSAIW